MRAACRLLLEELTQPLEAYERVGFDFGNVMQPRDELEELLRGGCIQEHKAGTLINKDTTVRHFACA